MSLWDALFGQKERVQQFQKYTPSQINNLNQLSSMGLSGLQGLQNSNPYQGFQPIANQAVSQFNQQIVPTLAERFTSMGGAGTASLSSPSFASQLGQAGAGLAEQLAAMQAQYGLANRQQMGNERSQFAQLLGLGLTPQFDTAHFGAQPGLLQQLAGPATQLALAYFTGGASGLGSLGGMGAASALSSLNSSGGYGQGFNNPSMWNSSMSQRFI